jgi:predicted ATPase
MQLKTFHVRLFRNIVDSGEIKVMKNTCLVGKNEAGKSSLIEALDRLNPAKKAKFDVLEDYPRWLLKKHQMDGDKTKDAVPITATYEADDDEIEELEERFGKCVKGWIVTATRKYAGEMRVEVNFDFDKFLKHFSGKHLSGIKDKLGPIEDTEALVAALTKLSGEVVEGTKEPTPDAQAAKNAKTALDKVLDEDETVEDALSSALYRMIPKTFYFAQYAKLTGRYNLAEILGIMAGTKAADPDKESKETAAEFVKLARIDPANVQSWDFEKWNAELEAVGGMLSDLVQENWKQNKFLKLRVAVEPQPVNNTTERFLQFRVEDTRHNFTSRLDKRSTGFQWFVSFMASFFEFQTATDLILLLDEPGLSLHARAQMDLLDSIDNNIAKERQVIFTTHSPFMVRPNALDTVRIVEDNGPPNGATTTNDAGVISDPDTLFPLQAALGYDIAQNLFIGNRNIILEGVSDFIYLTVISTHLRTLKRAAFPLDARPLPVKGATNIPTFIALLGGQLDLVVLIDGSAPRQKIENAIMGGRLNKARVFTVEQFCTVKDADIEDLFAPSEYVAIYNGTFKKTVKEKDLKGSDRITKRIEREAGEFDHGEVAAYFLANLTKFIPTLSEDTLRRFEACIDALVKALPPVKKP